MSSRLEQAGKAYRTALSETRAQSLQLAGTAKKHSTKALQHAADSVDDSPIRYVALGAFIGAMAGALLPKSRSEEVLAEETGRFFSDAVQKIADGAIDALAPKD
ncbi:hypothetical protein [Sphingorhabdus sp. Alg239-R122]|uniref:hypothetical protein n=1 Tax=Sphingorhabdus sp. Alg239-R122 TaxID=2305989 RepID=UPI0013D95788|nr:hypothetical protein [Sphingorhabdus sp. Alg239-R122]